MIKKISHKLAIGLLFTLGTCLIITESILCIVTGVIMYFIAYNLIDSYN